MWLENVSRGFLMPDGETKLTFRAVARDHWLRRDQAKIRLIRLNNIFLLGELLLTLLLHLLCASLVWFCAKGYLVILCSLLDYRG
jgi:hypothetical protein